MLPCLQPFRDNRPETVLARHRLEEDAGAGSASAQTAYHVCIRLHRDRGQKHETQAEADKSTTILCLLLRQLPASQARDLRVLLEPVLHDSQQGAKQHSCFLILDSLGISLKDIKDWVPIISLCDEVTLKDNPIGRKGLETLRESIRSTSGRYRRFQVPYWTANRIAPEGDQVNGVAPQVKRDIRLRKFQFAMATPVPLKMVLTLAGLAYDRPSSLSCSLPGGIVFSFAPAPDSASASNDEKYSELLTQPTLWSRWFSRKASLSLSFIHKAGLEKVVSLLQQQQLDHFWKELRKNMKEFEIQEVHVLCFLMLRSSPWMTCGPSPRCRKEDGCLSLVSRCEVILPGIHFLQSLDVSGSQMGDECVQRLCQSLTALTALQSLDVSGNQIGDEGMRRLGQVLTGLTALQSLDVSGNQSSHVGLLDQFFHCDQAAAPTSSQPQNVVVHSHLKVDEQDLYLSYGPTGDILAVGDGSGDIHFFSHAHPSDTLTPLLAHDAAPDAHIVRRQAPRGGPGRTLLENAFNYEVKAAFAKYLAQVDITDDNKNWLLLGCARYGLASRLRAVLLAGANAAHTDQVRVSA